MLSKVSFVSIQKCHKFFKKPISFIFNLMYVELSLFLNKLLILTIVTGVNTNYIQTNFIYCVALNIIK